MDMSKPIDPQLIELIAQQESSGLSMAAFAREHNVSKWRFYEARRALRDRDSEFIEIAVDPVQIDDVSLEIIFPRDLRVRISHDFDAVALRRLVEALTSC